MKRHGYTLFESADYAVIATMATLNRKTGNMVQIWILASSVDPITAVRTGQDSIVCGTCKHRGTGFSDRTCYVNVIQAPRSIWRKYQSGGYPALNAADYQKVFNGRKVRFGAYGDPILIPIDIVARIAAVSTGWTGYTHQWQAESSFLYRDFFMASVDSPDEYRHARYLGWRTFRVHTSDQPLDAREISCPASDEMGHRTTCERCTLCSGTFDGDPRKNIAILAHGAKKGLIQIGGAK